MRSSITNCGFLAFAGLTIAGCSPDRATAPDNGFRQPNGPGADLGNLTTAQILLEKPSSSTSLNLSRGPEPGYLADDFVVPEGKVWTVTAVALTGYLSAASLPFSISADANGLPGNPLPNADVTVTPTASDPNACDCSSYRGPIMDYLFPLPTALTLPAGTYWLAPQTGAAGKVFVFEWQVHRPTMGMVPAAFGGDLPASWLRWNTDHDFSFALFGTVQSTQTITMAPVTPNPAPLGSTATLDATASSALSVVLAAGPANVCTLSGTTLSFVGLGTCTVTADQAGDATYVPATQVTQDILVSKVSQTITFPEIAPSPATIGTDATLGATASSKLEVSYSSLTPNVCTVTGNSVSYVNAGVCTVAADQAGNATYDPATQATQSVTVVKITQAITFTSAQPAPAYINGSYVVGVTGGASGNPVGLTVGPPNVCTVTATAVKFVGVGICTVTANQAGTNAYDAAVPVSQSVKVDYHFDGFLDPVKNGVMNTNNAGNAVPLKWRLTDASGASVTTLTSARILVKELNCTLGTTGAQVAEQTIAGPALQNLGNGYYQYNWKSPASYAKSCKSLQLDLGEGSGVRTARFAFTK